MDLSGICLRAWARRGWRAILLLPIAGVFALVVSVRRALYRHRLLRSERSSVPVVVVGNIVAGGSGKTPLTLWLVEALRRRGRQPGIISRGYGGAGGLYEVYHDSSAVVVGDEPLLLKRRTGVPVYVGRDRVAASRALVAAYPQCDVIVSDDGLQHYRLARDYEIAVLDTRGVMNGWPLPAGPLREPPSRLREVDALVINGATVSPTADAMPPQFAMHLVGACFYALEDPTRTCMAGDLLGRKLAAVAAIGDPSRFFAHLRSLGLTFSSFPFPDHHRFSIRDLCEIDAEALMMTEKDAVKCAGLTNRPVWVLPVTARVEPDLSALVMEKLNGRPPA